MFNFTVRNLSCSSRYLFTRGSSQMLHSTDKNFFATSSGSNQNSKIFNDSKKNPTDSVKVDGYYKTDQQQSKYQNRSHSYFNKFTAGLGAAFAALIAPFSFGPLNSVCLSNNNSNSTAPAKSNQISQKIITSIQNRLSITQISANNPIQDRYCAALLKQVDSFYLSVFDGHGGWQLSQFAKKQLHLQLNKILIKSKENKIDDQQQVKEAITQAFDIVEQKFLNISRTCFKHGFSRAGYVGACALVTLIKNNRIYCANAGDCEAILISSVKDKDNKDNYTHREMSYAFTSNRPQEKQRLKRQFPNQQDIVKCRHQNACYVKNRLMPTRAFGDFALKHRDFNFPQFSKNQGYRHPLPNYTGPYITHKPDIKVHQIKEGEDKFLIMASDGLWDELSHEDVTNIVQKIVTQHQQANNQKQGSQDIRHKISKTLLEKALEKAAGGQGMSAEQMLQIPLGKRRSYHDDITIAVVDLRFI